MSKLLIKNVRIYNRIDNFFDVVVNNSKIEKILPAESEYSFGNCIDAEGRILTPGFIDVHIQGAGGSDILDASEEAIENISNSLAKQGTTGFLGTSVFLNNDENEHLKVAAEVFDSKSCNGAALLGLHLEGPFINPIKRGGLSETSIHKPSMDYLKKVLKVTKNSLKMMTIAPELDNCLEIIATLRTHNIIASFAHSEADYDETKGGIGAGINHATHLFNAMLPINHRNPGPIPAIFESNIPVQIISDGHHLDGVVVNLIYKNVGVKNCICITDGMQALGLPEGKYVYNGKEYESLNGAAKYLDGTLIGSTTPLGKIAYKFMQFTDCSIREAIETVTLNPAELLGIKSIGRVEEGADADLVIINKEFDTLTTIIKGKIVKNSLSLN